MSFVSKFSGGCAGAAKRKCPESQHPATARGPSQRKPDSRYLCDLQVLPKDISKRELVGMMKQFAITFSVRCSHCHAVSDDLTQGSFDSDEKDQKKKARELIRTLMAVRKPDAVK
jgi:hypothetical protein